MIRTVSAKHFRMGAVIAIVAAFLLAAIAPPMHDYIFYQEDWRAILLHTQGSDQWNKSIAYGPLYYLFAFFYNLNPKLPHLLMVACWALSSCYILNHFLKDSNKKNTLIVWGLLFINPLLWFYIIYYGSLDGLLCGLVLFGIVNYERGKYTTAAILIAFGILLKLVPIFIVPFLMIRNNKIKYTFTISMICLLSLGFGISYFIFNIDSSANFLLQAERPSSTLSLFRFLRGEFSPLKLIMTHPNLDTSSIYLIISSLTALFFIHIKYHFNYLVSCTLAWLFVITFHVVGNHQYYITLLFIILLLLTKIQQYNGYESLKKASFIFMTFLSSIPFIELVIRRFFFQIRNQYDDLIGLFVFLFSLSLAFFLFKIGFHNSLK